MRQRHDGIDKSLEWVLAVPLYGVDFAIVTAIAGPLLER